MTNSKLNHNLVGSSGEFSRINCQINNVLEEEDESEEKEKEEVMFEKSKCDLMSSVLLDNGSGGETTDTILINDVHLSNDEHSFNDHNLSDDISNPQNEKLLILQTNQQQPNKLIKCRNDFKTETCI